MIGAIEDALKIKGQTVCKSRTLISFIGHRWQLHENIKINPKNEISNQHSGYDLRLIYLLTRFYPTIHANRNGENLVKKFREFVYKWLEIGHGSVFHFLLFSLANLQICNHQ